MDDTATMIPDAPESVNVNAPVDEASRASVRSAASSRWATIAWIASSIALVVLVSAVWLRIADERSGAELANAIIAGERPAAPSLPTEPVFDPSDEGSGGDLDTPGLPDWYRAEDGSQLPNPDGEVLVVNWWASWCGPCRDEAPELVAVADDYAGRVTVVGLNAGAQDLRSDARAFAREYELDFPLVRADRADEGAWGVNGFPVTFVVGTDGRISSFVNGPIDSETLRGLLDTELDEDRS
jgi:thiol-disulfide isomerase/thioredoxin